MGAYAFAVPYVCTFDNDSEGFVNIEDISGGSGGINPNTWTDTDGQGPGCIYVPQYTGSWSGLQVSAGENPGHPLLGNHTGETLGSDLKGKAGKSASSQGTGVYMGGVGSDITCRWYWHENWHMRIPPVTGNGTTWEHVELCSNDYAAPSPWIDQYPAGGWDGVTYIPGWTCWWGEPASQEELDLILSDVGSFRVIGVGVGGAPNGTLLDNLGWTPEPATLSLLVLGGLAAIRRRK
jgi:hypothetical protein